MTDQLLDFLKLCFGASWLLYLPGVFLARLFTIPKSADRVVHIAIRLGLGIAFWPLFLLWSDFFRQHHLLQRWNARSGQWAVVIIGLGALLSLAFSASSPKARSSIRKWIPRKYRLEHLAFIALFVLAGITRWHQINRLVLPNWVDSVHHVIISKLIVDNGSLPTTYAPFLSNATFVYHWGYHVLVAGLAWLLRISDSFEIAFLVLSFGQILNVLSLPMFYLAGKLAFGSRRAALWSALFGTLISWYPAYYTSWGRYPHLVGLLLLPPLLMALLRLDRQRSLHTPWRVAAMILLAGIILIHVRITLFFATLLMFQSFGLAFQRKWRSLGEWITVGLGALLLTSPWLWMLLQHAKLPQMLVASTASTAPQLNSPFPWTLLWVPGIAELTSLATFGISGWLGVGDLPTRGRIFSAIGALSILPLLFVYRRHIRNLLLTFPFKPYILLSLWVGSLFLLVQLRRFGLPQPGFINPDSVVITFFAPVCLMAAGTINWWFGAIVPKHLLRRTTFALLLLIGVWGGWQMRNIINSDTILADVGDLKALHWIDENLPQDAKFAITVKPWIGATYVGSDGGYWISALTERRSIMPPAIYTIVMPRSEIQQTNNFLLRWMEVTAVDDQATFDFLRENGVTYIYLGSRNLSPLRQSLLHSPFADLIYDQDSVLIFALHPRK